MDLIKYHTYGCNYDVYCILLYATDQNILDNYNYELGMMKKKGDGKSNQSSGKE